LIRWLAFGALILPAGASARMPGLTMTEVWKQHVALDGQVIRVSGVVKRCETLGCSLMENPGPGARSLSLGDSPQFDKDIQSRLGLPVVVEGRLDATCLHSRADRVFGAHGQKDVVVCLDRAPELREPRLVSLR
jgi:hypothetical protein